MPYGGTIVSTVNADLVQTDVAGIVPGLTGPAGMTLSEVPDRLKMCEQDVPSRAPQKKWAGDVEYVAPWKNTVSRQPTTTERSLCSDDPKSA